MKEQDKRLQDLGVQISVDTLFKIADVLGIKVSNLFEEI